MRLKCVYKRMLQLCTWDQISAINELENCEDDWKVLHLVRKHKLVRARRDSPAAALLTARTNGEDHKLPEKNKGAGGYVRFIPLRVGVWLDFKINLYCLYLKFNTIPLLVCLVLASKTGDKEGNFNSVVAIAPYPRNNRVYGQEEETAKVEGKEVGQS